MGGSALDATTMLGPALRAPHGQEARILRRRTLMKAHTHVRDPDSYIMRRLSISMRGRLMSIVVRPLKLRQRLTGLGARLTLIPEWQAGAVGRPLRRRRR